MPADPVAPLVQELVPPPDPVRCCEQLAGLPYRLFLDSASRDPRLGRHSFLAADPVAVVRSTGPRTEWIDLSAGTRRLVEGDPLTAARGFLAPFASPAVPGLPPFQGGVAGYIAYDWGFELERLPAPSHDDLALDDLVCGVYDWVLAWDHVASRAWLISTGMPEIAPGPRAQRAAARAAGVRARLSAASFEARESDRPDAPTLRATGVPAASYPVNDGWWDPRIALRSSFTRHDYLEAVERVRQYILAGDVFQANLSQRFEVSLTEPAWALYRRLRVCNPAPFAAFLDFPETVVLSASPERFLRVDEAGRVETRPIKGTRPRGVGPEHDAALGQALTESPKDRAENLMIVDLMRNDLSRVCAPGSVRVAELFALEQYATVHHLVSTVVGQLAPGADALDLLRAAFPGGSITGAPKLRAMEIIAEIESSRRGVYCGSIGYWSVTGVLDANIAIRTAVTRGGRVYFHAGGGVVADSVPAEEYQETLDKARGFIDALAVPG
ncbi:MAG: aminodeoxychorismate synthase component I [Gemmatimonadetes bacterium]|nr:aminodeoxychorismate synthase component I [Gemmatimonadota bacterium]